MGLIGDGKTRRAYDWPRSPEQISANASFVSVSTGDDFACATATSGDVWCWGATWGSGNPESLTTSTPFVVRRTAGAIQVATGHLGTCVLTTTQIDCWGLWTLNQKSDFRSGLLGIYELWGEGFSWTATDAHCNTGHINAFPCGLPGSCPIDIYFNPAVKKVSGSCALSETGLIKCWVIKFDKDPEVFKNIFLSQTSLFG